MDALLEQVSDPSDWPKEWAFLRPLDAGLRCGLCYVGSFSLTQDIFRAPVALRECAHVFCSSCIRTHINQPRGTGSFCPNCRQKKAFDSELLPQTALEAAADSWRAARYVMDPDAALSSSRSNIRSRHSRHSVIPSIQTTKTHLRRTNGPLSRTPAGDSVLEKSQQITARCKVGIGLTQLRTPFTAPYAPANSLQLGSIHIWTRAAIRTHHKPLPQPSIPSRMPSGLQGPNTSSSRTKT